MVYFLLASAISFAGSLQPGPVNLSVIAASSNRQYKHALYIAIGGSLPEAFFAFVALFASSFISGFKGEILWLSQCCALVLLAIGIWLFRKPPVQNREVHSVSKYGLWSGVLLSVLNPQLVLFWIAIISWLGIHGLAVSQESPGAQISFALGTSAGAFALHLLLINVCRRFQQTECMKLFAKYSNKIVGIVLITLSLFEIGSFVLVKYTVIATVLSQ